MDDLIRRQDAIETIRKLPNAGIHWFVSTDAVFDALLKLPSVQQEAIRCKDCKHRASYWGNCKLLENKYHQSVLVSGDEFCYMAERREE